MTNEHKKTKEYKKEVINRLSQMYGEIKKIGTSQSLYYIVSTDVIVYFRYAKLSEAGKNVQKAFYGLRKEDIDYLQGKRSFICFLTNDAKKKLVIPFNKFEKYFSGREASKDGQFKTLAYYKPEGVELYFANIGKFKVDAYLDSQALFKLEKENLDVPELSHSQVQSLIGSIGIEKGFDIWVPKNDISKIDHTILTSSNLRNKLPSYSQDIENIISKIDVIWFQNTKPVALYEVEHSTPIYSGLLRFNDVLLTISEANNFNIIADRDREGKFGREINRPTFKQNKLIESVNFLDYSNVYNWYYNLTGKVYE